MSPKQDENETQIVLSFFSHNTPLPYKSSAENDIIAARGFAYALDNPSPQAPFSNIGDSQLVAIEQFSKIFTKAAENVKISVDPPQHQSEQTAANIPKKLHPGWTKCIT